MSQKSPVLIAAPRERVGSRYSERVRKQGRMPAVVYGKGEPPISVSVDATEFLNHAKRGEKLFKITLEGKFKEQMVLLRDIQFDWMGSNIVHADFARVALTDRVRTRAAIHMVGEAVGLKQAGAILLHPTNEVEIECLVSEIPEFLEVDISALDVGHAIPVSEVRLPSASIRVLTDKNHIVAQVVIQQEMVVGEETAATAEAAQPEVITAKKVEGEEVAAPGKAGAKAGAAAKEAKPAAAKPAAEKPAAAKSAAAKPAAEKKK